MGSVGRCVGGRGVMAEVLMAEVFCVVGRTRRPVTGPCSGKHTNVSSHSAQGAF